jgi:hypothetical protein
VDEVRKRAIRFIACKIPLLDSNKQLGDQKSQTDVAADSTVLKKDVEEFLIKQIKQVCNPWEFVVAFPLKLEAV